MRPLSLTVQGIILANIPSYIGPVVVAFRNVPTEIKFVNNLGTVATSNMTFWKYATDQTLHWADPLNSEQNWFMKDMKNQPGGFWNFGSGGAKNYGQNNTAGTRT